MFADRLVRDLYTEICKITLIDPHSHINPRAATARGLEDILGYHYYTELAHSAGLAQEKFGQNVPPREANRALLGHLDRIDNTAQYSWFLEICRTFLGFQGDRVTASDCDWLCDAATRIMNQPGWEEQVLKTSNVEKIFLTNDFDDTLEGFDTKRYVPCLRTDDLVFHLDNRTVRERLARATGMDVLEANGLNTHLHEAIRKLFTHFTAKGARACAISLPPDFAPSPGILGDPASYHSIVDLVEKGPTARSEDRVRVSQLVFQMLAQCCSDFKLPFDLMIGVNRRVYRYGVYQGQDLFDQRTSLIEYAELFNAFPEVVFPISVLTSAQNQELVSYSWIFPNVVTNGHWWYSNIPTFIERDARARLQAVPKTKQLGYYSDAYKLEFVLPKFNMYRRILAQILADDFVRPGVSSERQALDVARLLLRENTQTIFHV